MAWQACKQAGRLRSRPPWQAGSKQANKTRKTYKNRQPKLCEPDRGERKGEHSPARQSKTSTSPRCSIFIAPK